MAIPDSYSSDHKYCGIWSLLIGLFLFPCICFCPIDKEPLECCGCCKK